MNFLGTKFYGGIDFNRFVFSWLHCWDSYCIIHFLWRDNWIWNLSTSYGFVNGWPATETGVEGFSYLWKTQIRYAGVGAMVVGGIYTLVHEKNNNHRIIKIIQTIVLI